MKYCISIPNVQYRTRLFLSVGIVSNLYNFFISDCSFSIENMISILCDDCLFYMLQWFEYIFHVYIMPVKILPLKILLIVIGTSPFGDPIPPSRQNPTPVAPFMMTTLNTPAPGTSVDSELLTIV